MRLPIPTLGVYTGGNETTVKSYGVLQPCSFSDGNDPERRK